MSRVYRITPRAQRDIKDIGRYTLQRWGKEQRNAYILKIKARVELLAQTRAWAGIETTSARAS